MKTGNKSANTKHDPRLCRQRTQQPNGADGWRDVRSESITPTQQQITAGYQGHHSHSRVKHNKENIFPYLIVHDCFISTVSYLHSLPAPASYYKLCAAKLLNFHQSRVGMTDFNRDHGVRDHGVGSEITGSVLVIILQGNIFVELRTNLYLCRRRLRSQGARHGVMGDRKHVGHNNRLRQMADKENKLILYKDDEGKLIVNTLFADEDVWLTQAQLVEIYQSSKSNISEHLTNIFADNELDKDSVVRKFRTTAADGKNYQVFLS